MFSFKKVLALVLSAVLASQMFVTAFSFAEIDSTADYSGTVLAAINADYGDNSKAFTASGYSAQREISDVGFDEASEDVQSGKLIDAVIDDVEPLSPLKAAMREATLEKNSPDCISADYKVGDKKTVTSAYVERTTSNPKGTVNLVCLFTGENCTVWGTNRDEEENENCVGLGEFFDSEISKILELYGDKRIDTDRDGKIAVFVYEMNDVGGYFSTNDLIDSLGRIGNVWMGPISSGNNCDCIHVDSYWNLSFMCSIAIHEYQHYINASYCYVGKNNFNFLMGSESYVNEAFSTGAEFMLYNNSYDMNCFNNAIRSPGKYSLLNWTFNNCSYALSFVFGQYLRTRYALLINDTDSDYPGKGIYKKVLESRNAGNDNNTLGVIADILYPVVDYPHLKDKDARCRQLLTDFWLAVFCNNAEGIHGFGGEEWANEIYADGAVSSKLPEDGSIKIRSGMAAFYFINSTSQGTAKVTDSEDGLVFAGINCTYCKLTYDANGGEGEAVSKIARPPSTTNAYEYFYRFGYNHYGWATIPGAENPEYLQGEDITISHDTTLYAVWKPVEALIAGNTFKIDQYVYYRFVPQEDGAYTFNIGYGCNFKVLSSDEYVDYSYESYDQANKIHSLTYMLSASREYVVCGNFYEDAEEISLSINKEPLFYNLTYDYNMTDVEARSVSGRVSYRIDICWENNFGYNFCGWATEKSADTANYLPGDTVNLTGDTVLYAVWKPAATLEENSTVPMYITDYQSELYFKFTPKTDGTYRFSMSNSSNEYVYYCDSCLYDESNNYLGYLGAYDGSDGICSLQGGVTYYLECYRSYDNDDYDTQANQITVRKISDKISCRLTYEVGDDSLGSFTQSGSVTYTVTDYVPVSFLGYEFLGWSLDESSSAEYHSGDKITICVDKTLYAVWDIPDNEVNISFGKMLINMIKSFFSYFILMLKHDPLGFLGLR